jgi:hypothetical protein
VVKERIMKRFNWRSRFGLLLVGLVVCSSVLGACRPVTASAPAQAYSADVAVAWFELALDLVRSTPGYSPPVASRTLGFMGVALYETVQPGMTGYRSLAGQLNDLEKMPAIEPWRPYHWPSAANSTLAVLLRELFPMAPPEKLTAIDELEAHFAQQFAADTEAAVLQRSAAWGKTVADAVFTWSLTDGGHEGYMTNFPEAYVLPQGVGLWVKTPPAFSHALQPYWGGNRPFALQDGASCPAVAPPAYSEEPGSAFYREAMEVYTTVSRGDPQEVEIARFWADDPGRTATPPGHWVAILGQVLQQEEASLGLAAEAYAKLGIAVADAFITCWYTKYVYHMPRPITYIQRVIDVSWNAQAITDPVTTPPFPEYTSGHSVQSSAAALVLTDIFGESYTFTDHTNDYLGFAPRNFGSFAEAAEEAARSRLYGGIHYRAAIEQGLLQGRCVGEHVLALEFEQ